METPTHGIMNKEIFGRVFGLSKVKKMRRKEDEKDANTPKENIIGEFEDTWRNTLEMLKHE